MALALRSLTTIEQVDATDLVGLSEWFDPLLGHFASEALRCGGEVVVAEGADQIEGLYLFSPGERIGSVFARNAETARALVQRRPEIAMYSPFRLNGNVETFGIFEGTTGSTRTSAPFRHAVRVARPEDLGAVRRLLRETYGPIDDRWLDSRAPACERCFVALLDGQVAAVAWATAIGPHGRLHSLTVPPRFRRIGLATELWRARVLWLSAAGVDRFVSEIADRNTPSRTISERGGMQRVGELYRSEASPGRRVPGPA